jgi:hypothetical protein
MSRASPTLNETRSPRSDSARCPAAIARVRKSNPRSVQFFGGCAHDCGHSDVERGSHSSALASQAASSPTAPDIDNARSVVHAAIAQQRREDRIAAQLSAREVIRGAARLSIALRRAQYKLTLCTLGMGTSRVGDIMRRGRRWYAAGVLAALPTRRCRHLASCR